MTYLTFPNIPYLRLVMAMLGLCCYLGCRGPKTTSTAGAPAVALAFGQGGGFAGRQDAYLLASDGRIFALQSDTARQLINRIPAEQAAALLEQARALEVPTRRYQRPGNMYAFLEWREGEAANRITWNHLLPQIDSATVALHRRLMAQAVAAR